MMSALVRYQALRRVLKPQWHSVSTLTTLSEGGAGAACSFRCTENNGLRATASFRTTTNTSLLVPSRGSYLYYQRCWLSGRRGGKMGRRLENLREMAHEESHRQAQERHRIQKEQKKARKKKKNKQQQQQEEMTDVTLEREEPELAPLEEFEFETDFEELVDDDDTPVLPDPSQVMERMMRIVNAVEESFKSIRGAEPTPELFDVITVQAYGERTPLSSVAQVVITSPTLATVTCFDPSLATDVKNAIMVQLELNPQKEDDGVLRVPLPRPSMEARQRTVKQLSKQAENARARIRGIRRGELNIVKKKGEKGLLEGISKDEAFRVDKEINAVTDQVIGQLNKLVEDKQTSIMAV